MYVYVGLMPLLKRLEREKLNLMALARALLLLRMLRDDCNFFFSFSVTTFSIKWSVKLIEFADR